MTLSDSSARASIATLMRADAGTANRGSTLPSFDSASRSLKAWPEPVEELLGRGRVDGHGDLLAERFVERRIRDGQRRHEARELRPLPRDVLPFRVLNRQHADRAGSLQICPAHRLVVREQRAGNRRRPARQVQHDLALQIEAGEIVVLRLGHLQPISGKDQRRLDLRRRLDAHRERRFVAEHDRRRRRRPFARAPGSTAPRRCGANGSGPAGSSRGPAGLEAGALRTRPRHTPPPSGAPGCRSRAPSSHRLRETRRGPTSAPPVRAPQKSPSSARRE